MHGGGMRIRSTLGKGTMVVVRLPLTTETVASEERLIPSPPLAETDYQLSLV
jgi:hypothetical protein